MLSGILLIKPGCHVEHLHPIRLVFDAQFLADVFPMAIIGEFANAQFAGNFFPPHAFGYQYQYLKFSW